MLTRAALACVLGGLAAPVAAHAEIKELGQFDHTQRGSCPAKPCQALSRTTGYQVKVGDQRGPMVAPSNGRLVAFTIGFGKPGKKQTAFFSQRLGGKASVRLTVLNPRSKLRSRAVVSSPAFDPTPYFGTTAQFALAASLPIKKGQIAALTTSTWAPVMTLNQPPTSSWRASRNKGTCDDYATQTAQTGPNQLARYFCLYKGVRLAYSATFIPDPVAAT